MNKWLTANKLCLNVGTTKYVSFRPTSPVNLFVIELEIKECNSLKCLGVILDNELKFVDHIDLVPKMISKAIGVVSKFHFLLSQHLFSSQHGALKYLHEWG